MPLALASGEAAPTTHIMSIDMEDWYHSLVPDPADWPVHDHRIVNSTRRILDIFARTGTRATFFVLRPIAEREPKLIEEIHRSGHEIGSHGSDHRMIYHQSPDEFEDDVRRSVETLKAITGVAPRSYRAPCFSITKSSLWALDILKTLGFSHDSSIHPVYNPRYGIPSAPRLPHMVGSGIVEVPISTYPLGRLNLPLAGGFYFRAYPWFALKGMFRRLEARGERIVFYFHPWELDPGQPRITAPLGLRLRHNHALGGTAAKFERLCRDFRFGTLLETVEA